MPSNPMQRKVRNSYLLGILTMLILILLIGAVVFFLVIQPKLKAKKAQEQIKTIQAYRLRTGISVESGQEITSTMLEQVEIPVATTTTDFITTPIAGYKSKLDLNEGTILTRSMLYQDENATDDSLRYVEYSMITLPSNLGQGDYVDIRLRLPNGQDLIVLSQKQIISCIGKTIGFNLTEEEMLVLNSAIVEAYIISSSELYLTTYIEPGIQEAATATYVPTDEVYNLIIADPNIVATAKNALFAEYSRAINGSTTVKDFTRSGINNERSAYEENAESSIEAGVAERISEAVKARENYLSGLGSY